MSIHILKLFCDNYDIAFYEIIASDLKLLKFHIFYVKDNLLAFQLIIEKYTRDLSHKDADTLRAQDHYRFCMKTGSVAIDRVVPGLPHGVRRVHVDELDLSVVVECVG